MSSCLLLLVPLVPPKSLPVPMYGKQCVFVQHEILAQQAAFTFCSTESQITSVLVVFRPRFGQTSPLLIPRFTPPHILKQLWL
jgi:hypothetical protein